MGINTDFIGCVDVAPALNDAEQQYLTAFATSRRFARRGGSYNVPFNPAAERDDDHDYDTDTYNTVAPGQPSLWCGWVPAWDGNYISYDGREKFYGATRWLQYLIDHFLAPDAYAGRSEQPWFDDFTFDHVLDGAVAAFPHDTGELYLIRVEKNVVRQELVRGGYGPTVDPPSLPYQEQEARWRAERTRPRRAAG